MMKTDLEAEILRTLEVLRAGGTIAYPTDTVWGLGCDASNVEAIEKIYQIKQRDPVKSFILLMATSRQLLQYLASPPPELSDWIANFGQPTTVIYEQAINLPEALIAADGTIAVRLTRDPFCRSLIQRLKQPLVSTSANFSGQPTAACFKDIDAGILAQVDYVVRWRQEEQVPAAPSALLRLHADGSFSKIR